ncbi:nucleotide disphospho-sugar-binding domain-containing protein [Micromonospora sp. NPDC001898]|uniref:nucleotide disphospho-sugar-binding domain-containing protein n=1 Tax=Micromonospora sp. NPDC001898 TaxID=3364221 RepID=UPI0036AC19AD
MNSEHFKAVERLVAVAAGNEAHVSAAAEQIGLADTSACLFAESVERCTPITLHGEIDLGSHAHRAEIAELVADSGAGVRVPLEAADTAHLSAAVARALSDTTMRKSAESLRQEMLAAPSPSEVVETLEELV